MKRFKFLAMLMLALAGCVFTACGGGDDDDENDGDLGGTGGSGVLTVTGSSTTSGFNYAYYYFDVEREQSGSSTGLEVYCYLAFYTYDYIGVLQSQDESRLPSLFSILYIGFLAGHNEMATLPEGTYQLEDLEAVIGTSKAEAESNPHGVIHGTHEYSTDYEGDDYFGTVEIKKSGSGYTVKMTGAKVKDSNLSNSPEYDASFYYAGAISPSSAELHEE